MSACIPVLLLIILFAFPLLFPFTSLHPCGYRSMAAAQQVAAPIHFDGQPLWRYKMRCNEMRSDIVVFNCNYNRNQIFIKRHSVIRRNSET